MDLIHEIFSVIVLILGVMLIQITFKIDDVLKDECVNTSLHTSNKIILIIAVLAIGSTIGGLACRGICNCSGNSLLSKEAYIVMIFILGVSLLSLGIVIKTNAVDNCTDASKSAGSVITFGVVLTCITILYFTYVLYTTRTKVQQSGLNKPGSGGIQLQPMNKLPNAGGPHKLLAFKG